MEKKSRNQQKIMFFVDCQRLTMYYSRFIQILQITLISEGSRCCTAVCRQCLVRLRPRPGNGKSKSAPRRPEKLRFSLEASQIDLIHLRDPKQIETKTKTYIDPNNIYPKFAIEPKPSWLFKGCSNLMNLVVGGQSFRPKLSSCQPKLQMHTMTLPSNWFSDPCWLGCRKQWCSDSCVVTASSCYGKPGETRVSTGIFIVVDNGHS